MLSTDTEELEVREVTKSFGGTRALDGVSVGFERGRVTCVIGPNGAGKTTLFNAVSGLIPVDRGDVLYKGASLGRLPPYAIARLGVGRLFQDVRVFKRMTLLENVAAAHKESRGEMPWAALLWPLIGGQEEEENLKKAKAHLEFVGLAELADQWAEHVSYGQQKLMAIARLLNNGAECFLLDEPVAGVNPVMVEKLLGVIRRLAEGGKTVVVIEHNLGVVRELADWVYLMDNGRIEAFGPPSEILRDSALARFFPSL